MLLNLILLSLVIIAIIILFQYLKHNNIEKQVIPECKFSITDPKFNIHDTVKIAKYSVLTKNKDRYFRDFPLGFKFYSDHKFRTKIKITYTVSGDDEVEIIYDRIVEFEDNAKEHIYYINDVIIGSIDIEIYTDTDYGNPTIQFEILQSSMCHMSKEHKIEIVFPE